jgi:hypothetical protein
MQALAPLLLLAVLVAAVPQFREDVEEFKAEKEQMERLLGCWMTVRDHFPHQNDRPLPIVKECLRRLDREDVRNKLTSFIGKSTAPPKRLDQIMTHQEIDALATTPTGEPSEFDKMLLQYMEKYEAEVGGMKARDQESMKERLDEEVAKRQKYYLGFIPANKFTFMLLLISGGVFLLFLCSCCRFRSTKEQRKEEERRKQREKVELYKVSKLNASEVLKKFSKAKKA